MECCFLQHLDLFLMELVELYIHPSMELFFQMGISKKDFNLGSQDGFGMTEHIIKANQKTFSVTEKERKFMGSMEKECQKMVNKMEIYGKKENYSMVKYILKKILSKKMQNLCFKNCHLLFNNKLINKGDRNIYDILLDILNIY